MNNKNNYTNPLSFFPTIPVMRPKLCSNLTTNQLNEKKKFWSRHTRDGIKLAYISMLALLLLTVFKIPFLPSASTLQVDLWIAFFYFSLISTSYFLYSLGNNEEYKKLIEKYKEKSNSNNTLQIPDHTEHTTQSTNNNDFFFTHHK